MAEKGKKPRKRPQRNPEYPLLLAGLTAARTPRAPREECAVFGCRSSSLDPAMQFHPFPEEPERWSAWLKLINRQDLSDKLSCGRCSAQVCSLHFAPGQLTVPTLELPKTSTEFVHAGPPELGIVKAECVEVKFEPEYPPACSLDEEPSPQSHVDQLTTNVDLPRPNVDLPRPNVDLPRPNVDLPRPNVDLPRPNVNIPRPNVYLPGPNVDIPRPNVYLAGPNVDLPGPNVDLPRPNVYLPGPNVDLPRPNVYLPGPNVDLPRPNVYLPGPNVDIPRPNVYLPVPNILPSLNIIQPVLKVNQPNPTRVTIETQTTDLSPTESLSPTYFDYQTHVESQTDSAEALKRLATFSAIEQIHIPPTTHRLVSVNQNSVASQTSDDLTEFFTRGIKRRLGAELEEAHKKLKLAENPQIEKTQFLKGCDKYLDEKIANFIQSHAYLYDKFEGNKYPESFKSLALNLYLRNPTAYKFVERFFNLPSKRTIQKFRMPVKTGINERLMEFFKVKVEQMSVQAKMCVVCFDVMRLSRNLYYDVTNDYLCGTEEVDQVCGPEHAEYAAVVTVRGLYNRWKQPVSFAFLSKKNRFLEVKAWLVKTITVLMDIGLAVKALVTDSDDEFVGITVDEAAPYFEVYGKKIYHIFDVPDLMKKARDQLMECNFHIEDAVAKWEHVVGVYESDRQQELRLMTDITENHVRPDAESRNDIKLATQVFSNSVAAAMHFYVVARLHHKQTKDTVKFMTKMSNLFDILYSRTLANAYRGSAAQQRFLKDTIEYLKAIEVKDNHGNIHENKFVTGLIITIKSVMALMVDQKRSQVRYLLTKNLSKDFMKVFFDEIKRLTNCDRPTPIKFARAFRKLFLVNLLNDTKKGATGLDMNVTLGEIADYVKVDIDKKNEPDQTKCLDIGVTDYKVKWPSNEYIAGYLLWKCLERHTCPQLIQKLCEYCKFDMQDSPELLIQTYKFYNSKNVDSTFVKKPPPQLTDFVGVMEKKFYEYLKRWDRNNFDFGKNVYAEVENDSFLCPCMCFPLKFMKMLYIRLKIYDTLKKFSKMNNQVS